MSGSDSRRKTPTCQLAAGGFVEAGRSPLNKKRTPSPSEAGLTLDLAMFPLPLFKVMSLYR